VPLHSGDCKNTKLDEPWIWEVLEKYEPFEEPQTQSYLPLMRSANKLFDDEQQFAKLLPRVRSKTPELAATPLGQTERVAYDWLQHGGKRFRPFITLAAYDAMMGGVSLASGANGDDAAIPDGVGRVAMAIEAFHKASLVHDDIEDADLYRYGRETLHRTHGVGPAINIGDQLIGIGYKLVAAARTEIGAEAAVDILDRMANAHVRLCDGQGAEMAWQASPDFTLTPLDALQIYALKTSPAFEAALYAGIRMAGSADAFDDMIPQFARHVGVGFQILNDLKDWRGDENNKLVAGQDALALRPTVLLALALQAASEDQKGTIRAALSGNEHASVRFGRLRRAFSDLNVFDQADSLVEKSRARAEQLADAVENEDLRRLLYFFIDTVLAEEDAPAPKPNMLVDLPVTAGA
jgi:geranylgeranyl diphosphate synthase, type II